MKSTGLMCFGILLAFLTLPTIALAEFSLPYVVDEKPQVIFGDSVSIATASTTYLGLENYTQDYVGGYAHITFTYTHHRCCFANFPPEIYITNGDPRLDQSPSSQTRWPTFHIPSQSSGSTINTNWFLYDIQFDITGYSVSVKEAGQSEIFTTHVDVALGDSDWVALANRYPNSGNENSMAFTPVPAKEETSSVINPVIVIPGIMGSARKNGELVIDPILHTYDDLLKTLDENYYTPGVDLFTFPYEWRDSNALTANLLEDKIEEVKQICNCAKVDLIAHSMGGLVARQYIQSAGYRHDVDQVIFLGTPHKGSPKAYLQWEAGRFPPEFNTILNEVFFQAEALRNGYLGIFDYIRSRPISSVQELLPVTDYLKDKNTGILRSYPANYPRNNFLETLNSNTLSLINSGVRITNIIGDSGLNTIGKIRVFPSVSELWEHGIPDGFFAGVGDSGLEQENGDRTITVSGATLDSEVINEVSASSHNRIVTESASRVFNLLVGRNATTTFDRGFELSAKVLLMQLLSPVDFVVTAPDGKKIGKNFGGGEYDEIPGAFYSGNATDEEYITILNPLDGEYKLELQGTGSGGKYTVMTDYVSDATSTGAIFVGTTTPNQVNTLELQISSSTPESISLDPDVDADINSIYQKGWINKKTRDALLLQVKLLVRFDKKTDTIIEKLPNGSKKQKKVQKVVKVVDKILARLVLAQLDDLFKKKQITKEGYELLKIDLNWLINH